MSKEKWERFIEWYNNAHPIVQTMIAAPIGGTIGVLIGMAIWKLIN
jgi:predicted nucleic acid-binding OB-fold protein